MGELAISNFQLAITQAQGEGCLLVLAIVLGSARFAGVSPALKKSVFKITQATSGSDYWQARGSADWERRLAALF